jgi:hypothetical protein
MSVHTERRSVTFFLSPRLIDLDSYLPVAMELKAERPNWDIRFVCFNEMNLPTIEKNDSIRDGIKQCGEVVFAGARKEGWLSRVVGPLWSFLRICAPILTGRGPLVFNSRPFSFFPYDVIALLARLRGGLVILLCKNRSPDSVHELTFALRELPPQLTASLIARVVARRDADLVLHYHDEQDALITEAGRYGRSEGVPRLAVGMPHRLPRWRDWIERELARERDALTRDGVLATDARVFGIFAAKPGSSDSLGVPGAVARSFEVLIQVLLRRFPEATILVRAHPMAVGAAYIRDAIAMSGGRIRLTFMHPEVLISLSHRVFANNPTNIFFHGFGGCLIDVSEYPDIHFDRRGEVSLADGLGPVYVDPRRPDFEEKIVDLVRDDGHFSAGDHDGAIRALIERNPATIEPFLRWVEDGNDRSVEGIQGSGTTRPGGREARNNDGV